MTPPKDIAMLIGVLSGLVSLELLDTNKAYAQQSSVAASQPVPKGFVFVDGKYLDAPYAVTRKGLQVLINNTPIVRPSRHPGLKPFVGEAELNALSDNQKERLLRSLESTRKIYEDYLNRDYCYMCFSSGGHVRLDPYTAAYDLPRILGVLTSGKARDAKLNAIRPWNWHLVVNIDPLVDDCRVSSQLSSRLGELARDLLKTEEFGTKAGDSVEQGFVFLHGEYVEVPYVVSRRGLGLFVNDQLVRRPQRWPVKVYTGDEDPERPAEINNESSLYDDVVSEFLARKSAYLRKNYSPEEEARRMEQVLRGLPFVKEATLNKSSADVLDVTTMDGTTVSQSLVSMRRASPLVDRSAVLQDVERHREHLEKSLRDGACLFLANAAGELRLSQTSSRQTLHRMVEVLDSSVSVEEKAGDLSRLGLESVADELLAKPDPSWLARLRQRLSFN